MKPRCTMLSVACGFINSPTEAGFDFSRIGFSYQVRHFVKNECYFELMNLEVRIKIKIASEKKKKLRIYRNI